MIRAAFPVWCVPMVPMWRGNCSHRRAAARPPPYEVGGIDQIAGLEEVDALADKMVARIAENAPLTLKAAKLSIRAAEGVGRRRADRGASSDPARQWQRRLSRGPPRLREKRAPRFTGS